MRWRIQSIPISGPANAATRRDRNGLTETPTPVISYHNSLQDNRKDVHIAKTGTTRTKMPSMANFVRCHLSLGLGGSCVLKGIWIASEREEGCSCVTTASFVERKDKKLQLPKKSLKGSAETVHTDVQFESIEEDSRERLRCDSFSHSEALEQTQS